MMLLPLATGLVFQSALIRSSFANGEDGWALVQPTGTGSKLSVSKEPADVKSSIGSLKMEYAVESGQLSMAMLPVAEGALAKVQSFNFWVKSDQNTPLMFTVQEKGGGRFQSSFFAPKGAWQKVEVSLTDLTPASDADAPKDANGKLDADKIEAISLTDVDQVLIQNQTFSTMLGLVGGKRTLLLSDFQASPTSLPDSFSTASGEFRPETFARPQCMWMSVGTPVLSVAPSSPVKGKALQVDYKIGAGKITGMMRGVKPGGFAGKTVVTFDMAAKKACNVLVQFEEIGGGKYNTIVEVPEGSKSKDYSYVLASLLPSDDSKDDNNKLDPEKIAQVIIIDLSGMFGKTDSDNTLWVGNLVGKA